MIFNSSGSYTLPKDDELAEYWYRKAADHGNIEAENDLAWLYATSASPALRNPEAALEYAHRAIDAQDDHPSADSLDTLAAAYYANGKYQEAIETQRQVVARSGVPEFAERLTKYLLAAQQIPGTN